MIKETIARYQINGKLGQGGMGGGVLGDERQL